MNPEDVASPQERKEPAENREAAEDFASSEAAERMVTEASSEVAELEAGGLPVAEKLAAKLGSGVDAATEADLGAVSEEAEAAKSELEANLRPGGEPGAEKREGLKRSYEYRDSEGGLIGRAEAEFGDDEIPVAGRKGKTPKGRMLKSFRLFGSKDGQATEVDLLKMTNPRGIEVVIGDDYGGKYHYDRENRVEAPPLDTPGGIAVLLHELGHEEQSQEAAIASLDDLYTTSMSAIPGRIRESLKEVADVVPELSEVIAALPLDAIEAEQETIGSERAVEAAAIDGIRERIREADRATEKAVDDLFEAIDSPAAKEAMDVFSFGESPVEKIDRLSAVLEPDQRASRSGEISRLREEAVKKEALNREVEKEAAPHLDRKTALDAREAELLKPVRDILLAPTRIKERDATVRALRWLRKLREEAGIDFFKKTKGDPRAVLGEVGEEGDCEADVAETLRADEGTEASVSDVLRVGLESHQAKTFRYRTGPEDVGVMPTPKTRKSG